MPREDVDVLDIAEEIAEPMRISAQEKQVSINVSGEHCTVRGVREMIIEIVQNLCGNAVKYNVPGGKVDVSVKKTDNHVVLTVADTGIGIPPGDRDRVFERFYRAEKSRVRKTGGYGLGLAIALSIAELHGGKISAVSNESDGTTFIVRLPIRSGTQGTKGK